MYPLSSLQTIIKLRSFV